MCLRRIQDWPNAVRSIIYRRSNAPVSVPVSVPVNDSVNDSVNVLVKVSLAEQIYALIQERPGLNRVLIAEMIGVDVRTVGRKVSALRGRIEFRGAPKTGGYYVVER